MTPRDILRTAVTHLHRPGTTFAHFNSYVGYNETCVYRRMRLRITSSSKGSMGTKSMNRRLTSMFPLAVIVTIVVVAVFDFFLSQAVAICTIVASISCMLVWRQLVLVTLLSSDYSTRFDSASRAVMMRSAKWSAIITVTVFAIAFMAAILAFRWTGSWSTFSSLLFIVVIIAKSPWIAIATDAELNRIDAKPS